MPTELSVWDGLCSGAAIWALAGALTGWGLERLALWLPLKVLAPYGAQIRAEDWHGPGGGLTQVPRRSRQLALALLNALAWAASAWAHPAQGGAVVLVWAVCASVLLVLAVVDWNTTLLPDVLVLGLLWAGLLASERGWTLVPVATSLWSAVCWYVAMQALAWTFERLTGRTGMGEGDAKLLAAMAAWWGGVPVIWALWWGSVLVILYGLIGRKRGMAAWSHVPFGPFLVIGLALWTAYRGLTGASSA